MNIQELDKLSETFKETHDLKKVEDFLIENNTL
jgi:hypothetical protein